MATVIDSLIIELGLDPSKFAKGQKEAANSFLKTRNEAEKSAKGIEEAGKRAAAFFSQVQVKVLELFAVFTAGKGLREFIEDTVEANADLGRLAKTLDTTTQVLSTWRNLATLTGGTAEGITQTIRNLTQQFNNFALTGESSVIPYFRALRVNIADVYGRMRPFGDILLDLADRVQGMDKARAYSILSAMGIDENTINLILLGRKAIQDMLDQQKKYAVTPEQAAVAVKLQMAWENLKIASESLGREFLTRLAPALERVMGSLLKGLDWLQDHKDVAEGIFYAMGAAAIFLAGALLAPLAEIIAVTAAIIAIGAAIGYVREEFPQFTSDLSNLFVNLFTGNGEQIRKSWQKLLNDLGADFKNFAFGDIVNWLSNAFAKAFGWIERRINALSVALTGHNLFNDEFSDPTGKGGAIITPKRISSAIAIAADALPNEAKALLGAIGSSEGSYNEEYGGDRFTDFSHHPGVFHRITSGPNKGKYSSAAGRYQFLLGTWRKLAKALNLKDFSPASQDKAAWAYAQMVYQHATHRDLDADLKSNDPKVLARIGSVLSKVWTSLPGGIEATQSGRGFSSRIMNGVPAAAASAGAGGGFSNLFPSGGNTSTSETNINTIVVNTNEKDAPGIARDIGSAIRRDSFAQQANYGFN